MMQNIRRLPPGATVRGSILLLGSAVWLAACASKPTVPNPSENVIKASYAEKTNTVPLSGSDAGVSCPVQDGIVEKAEWRKVVAYADACVRAKEWGRVEKIGNHLATQAPLTPWGPYFLALSASNHKDFPRARWMLELALKKAPNEGLFHYELGRLAWETGDGTGAMKEFKLASDLNPGLTDAHVVLGRMALQADDLSGARRYIERALSNESKNLHALQVAAQIELKSREYAKAEEYLYRVIQQNPRSALGRLVLAQTQEVHLKKMQEALQNYRALKQLSAEHKLDAAVQVNLDEKIQALEKNLSQAEKTAPRSDRQPTGDGKVTR